MRNTRAQRRRRKRIATTLSILLIALLTVIAVVVAAFYYRPTAEDPATNTDTESTQTVTVTVTDTDTETDTTSSETVTDTDTNITDSETETTTTVSSTTGKPINITTNIPKPEDGSPKKVAFTFDDGPHYSYTRQIADLFVEYGGKCTYFVVANRVSGSNGEAMKYAASLGHEIGSHGLTHNVYFGESSSEEAYQNELQSAHDIILSAIGCAPTLMRPPGGTITKNRIADSIYSVILWNVDPHDWKYHTYSEENVMKIVNSVLDTVTDGDIILMHDIWPNTPEAVKRLLPILQERGYEFVTVSELLGEYKAPGKRYSNAY